MLQIRRALLAASLITLAVSTGCNSDKKSDPSADNASGGGDKVASCDMPGVHTCREYRGGNLALGTESLAKLCMPEISPSARFTETACPTEHVIASCAKPEGKYYYYEGYEIPAADNEKMCTDGGGTFKAAK